MRDNVIKRCGIFVVIVQRGVYWLVAQLTCVVVALIDGHSELVCYLELAIAVVSTLP